MNIPELIQAMKPYPDKAVIVKLVNDDFWKIMEYPENVALVVFINEDYIEYCEDSGWDEWEEGNDQS